MEVEEPKLPSGPTAQPGMVKDIPNESPVYDDAEDWASCVTESILYDTQDALPWNNQVMDMNYPSLSQYANGFGLDPHLGLQPK